MTILAAAQDVLVSNPDASVDDIAAAANMVRRTVYGHFPTRQDLIASVVEVGAQELVAHVGDIDVRADDAVAEMARLVLRTWGTAKRFGLIIEVARRSAPEALAAAMRPFNTVVADLIRHGQAQKAFQSPVDADLLAHLLHACAMTFLDAQRRGVWTGDESDVAYSQLLSLGTPSAAARAAVDQAVTSRSVLGLDEA
jgi:AcrR family transcriptional regulator